MARIGAWRLGSSSSPQAAVGHDSTHQVAPDVDRAQRIAGPSRKLVGRVEGQRDESAIALGRHGRADLRGLWCACRDSNPKPSDPYRRVCLGRSRTGHARLRDGHSAVAESPPVLAGCSQGCSQSGLAAALSIGCWSSTLVGRGAVSNWLSISWTTRANGLRSRPVWPRPSRVCRQHLMQFQGALHPWRGRRNPPKTLCRRATERRIALHVGQDRTFGSLRADRSCRSYALCVPEGPGFSARESA